jgi:dynein light intermediate chain
VALDGPERGLLLMRVRDELKMTTDAYKTLFASSVVFGIKKQLRAEQGIPALESQVSELETEKSSLELEVQELRSKLEILEKQQCFVDYCGILLLSKISLRIIFCKLTFIS